MSFKDSRIQWIGKIPSHWSISKIKYQTVINKHNLNEQTPDEYIIKYIDIGNVNSAGQIQELQEYKFCNAPSRARRIVKKDDLLISTVRTYLKAITSILDDVDDNVICSTGFAVLTPKHTIDPLYLHYLSRSEIYIDEIVSRSTGVSYPAINASEIGNLECILPPLCEQRLIGSFLHRKSSEVEGIIQSKLKYISLLEQQRQSIITEAVTKGLNPNVKMKDSGVEWIGEIPEHWKVVKLGWFISIFGSVEITDGHFKAPLFKVNDLNADRDNLYLNQSNEVVDNNISPIVGNKILIPKRGAAIFTNKVRIVGVPCYIDSNLMAIVPKNEFKVEYLAYLLWARKLGDIADISTIPQINNKQINPLKVPLPSVEEQNKIINYIEEASMEILVLISIIQKQIQKLKQYRQALIYEAVTGKIDVRDMEID